MFEAPLANHHGVQLYITIAKPFHHF